MLTNKILVEFKDGVSEERINDINGCFNVTVERILNLTGMKIYVLIISEGSDPMGVVAAYSLLPEVKYAEPNIKHYLM